MTKWELTRYLIDAKKCVDNILFIADNVKKLKNLYLKDIVDDRLRKFYINLRIIYDKVFSKTQIKQLGQTDVIFKETCHERDKNYAHKDDNYVSADFQSIKAIVDLLKVRLEHCFELCRPSFPENVTLNYIDYDHDLYRFINKIDPNKEEKLMKAQHPGYNEMPVGLDDSNSFIRKAFNDTEDIKKVDNPNEYAVIMKAGLTVREGIQEMQDSCIRINVLYGENMWAVPNMDVIQEMKQLIEECPDLPFLY